jgi:hypothetical protein
MNKERKKTKSKRRTTLTTWVSRTERCNVAQLPRRTKHIPRRQKVVTVGNFRTGSDGSGPSALDRVSGASGIPSCSRFHLLCCTSITSCKHTVTERAASTLCHTHLSCSVIFPVHCTVSSLTQFPEINILFMTREGQVKDNIIRFVRPKIVPSRTR